MVAKRFSAHDPRFGSRVGALYAVNSLGAAVGAFVTGFLLLPGLGVIRTNLAGAALNFAVCAALVLRRSVRAGEPAVERGESRAGGSGPAAQGAAVDAALALAAVFVSGLTAMVFEVAWTRVLSLNIGTSAYAFTLILSAFIAGLALGSLLSSRILSRWREVLTPLAVTQALIGLTALLVTHALGGMPLLFTNLVALYQQSVSALFIVQFTVVLLVILVPTLLLGAMFPMALRVCANSTRTSAGSTGFVYAVNTAGSVVGSLAAVFLFIPWIGVRGALIAASLINAAFAALAMIRPAISGRRPAKLIPAAAALALAIVAAVFLPDWNRALMSSGPFLYAGNYRRFASAQNVPVEKAMTLGRPLLYYKDGLSATVSVRIDEDGNMSLQIDGKTDASSHTDRQTQYLLAQLPILLHPDPKSALVIGLGSGITLGSLERYPIPWIDCIEISEAVVDAATLFAASNRRALEDPRLRLHIADGRNWLAFATRKYDVISSEPSNPWIAGIGSLFTREFFESAAARLNPGGVMVQWLHAYSMSAADFKTVVRTFAKAFPHVTVWEASPGKDYLLAGSRESAFADWRDLAARTARPEVREDLAVLGILDLPTLLSRLVVDEASVSSFASGGLINTDDNALLEFSAPLSLYSSSDQLMATLTGLRREAVSRLSLPGADREALARYLEAKELTARAIAALGRGRSDDAFQVLERAYALSPQDPAITDLLVPRRLERGNASLASGDAKAAAAEYESIVKVAPDNALAYSNLGSLRHQAGLDADARMLLERAVQINPYYAAARFNLAETYLALDLARDARRELDDALRIDPDNAHGWNSLGVAYERLGDVPNARKQYEKALSIEPRYGRARINLGNSYFLQGDYPAAIKRYREALQVDAGQYQAWYNIGAAYFKMERWPEARDAWTRTLELNPNHAQARAGLALLKSK